MTMHYIERGRRCRLCLAFSADRKGTMIMDIERIIKSADFSKETNFKDRLGSKLNMRKSIRRLGLEEDELDDEQLVDIVAARGLNTVPVNPIVLEE